MQITVITVERLYCGTCSENGEDGMDSDSTQAVESLGPIG